MPPSSSKRAMAFLGCGLLVCAAVTDSRAETNILLVAAAPDHPWGSHMYQFECELLARCLNQHAEVRARSIPAWPPTAETLDEAASIVFYSSPAGEVVLAPAHRDRFLHQLGQGSGFVAIHWGTGVGYSKLADRQEIRDQYRRILGGWFRRPPCDVKVGQADLTLLNKEHAICRGWEPWRIRDEFYLNPVLDQAAKPLLSVQMSGQDHVVGWTCERAGKGRSVGITLGHFHENFTRDDFRRLLVNAILWSAHVEVPPSGATVDVRADALELPPRAAEKEKQ